MALVQFDKQPETLCTHFIKHIGYSCVYEAHMSATPDRSSAMCHLKPGDALEGGKIFHFYPV